MKAFTPAEADLLKTVGAHLSVLHKAQHAYVDDYALRAASTSLRILLIDGNLARAWEASGISGRIETRPWCFCAAPSQDAIAFCGGADILPGKPLSFG